MASASRIRLAVVIAAVAAALVATPSIRADPPVFANVPANATVEATSATGAVFTYTDPTATDTLSDLAGPPVCVPSSGFTFPIGTTPVICTVIDTSTGAATVTFNVTVVDTTPPSITVPANITTAATSSAGATVNYSASATDLVDPSPSLSCAPASGSTFPIGATTVTCNASDHATPPNSSSATFTVTVQDTTPPTITVPANITTPATSPAGATVTYTASATDAIDPNPTLSCSPPSGSTFPVGVTTVTCDAHDASGNAATPATFTVTVTDTTPPTITVPSNITASATSSAGATVTYTATATDTIDPSPILSCAPPSGSTFPLGTTTVTCNAHDASGNAATPATFTITVQDTIPPTINVPGNIAVSATSSTGAPVSFTATATDAVDPNPTVTCSPASGSTFAIGMTTVTCNAHDASGNAATPKSFTVTVSDTTPPVISNLPGTAGTLSVEANSPSGSSPSYTLPTAVDAVAGPVPVTCVPPPGTLLSIGTHTVTCSASDNATPANTSTATFTIDIVDTTPPVLTVPAPITVSTTGTSVPASTPAIAAFLGSAVAHDIADPAPTVTNNAPATFPLGTTTVTFTAKDASGNTSAASAAVVVVQQAPNTPPPPPPPVVDRTPPDDVTGVQAVGGGGQVILTWTDSTASDFDHVEIVRSDVSGASAVTIYTGNASTFVDSSVRSGTEYRYVITAFDHAGNRSAGIAVLVEPSRAVLVAPAAGAHVTKAPLLAWVAARGATYYNVQLFRGSRKILSLWPGANHLQLPKAWRFGGHKFTLSRGTYTWYVWPGLGARSAKRYGAVLGKSTFVMG